jgi:hypothetical protein
MVGKGKTPATGRRIAHKIDRDKKLKRKIARIEKELNF